MSEIEELWAKADSALAEAVEMPWGPKKIEALKKAGLLRNKAAQKEIALGQFPISRWKTGEPVRHNWRRSFATLMRVSLRPGRKPTPG